MRTVFSVILSSALLGVASPQQPASVVRPAADPYSIFGRARAVWELQRYPKSVRYTIELSTRMNDTLFVRHYDSIYDSTTNEIIPDRVSVEQRERPHVPAGMNISIGPIAVGPHEESADPFGIPMLAPNYSFGIAPPPRHRKLTDKELIAEIRAEHPSPMATPTPSGLREIGFVTAVRHDYIITLVGIEPDERGAAYHLALQPLREPKRYRLRDLWIDTKDFSTHKLISYGNFVSGAATEVPWLVTFVEVDGVQYIGTERSQQQMSEHGLFGMNAQTWDDFEIVFTAPQTAVRPAWVAPWGSESFLSEPDYDNG